MATAVEKAFANMTAEQREEANRAIGEMMGIPSHVRRRRKAIEQPLTMILK